MISFHFALSSNHFDNSYQCLCYTGQCFFHLNTHLFNHKTHCYFVHVIHYHLFKCLRTSDGNNCQNSTDLLSFHYFLFLCVISLFLNHINHCNTSQQGLIFQSKEVLSFNQMRTALFLENKFLFSALLSILMIELYRNRSTHTFAEMENTMYWWVLDPCGQS